MNMLQFSINILAPKEKVWQTLWNDATYRQWTAVFQEGSYAVSDWKEGSRIEFLTPEGLGMFAVIDKKVDNEVMIFRHLGEIKNGVDEPKDWGGAKESYYLSEANGVTVLRAMLDANAEMEAYFSKTFPKAMEAVKQISEE